MKVVRTIQDMRQLQSELNAYRDMASLVGFVPTLGFLHEGHASLLRRAREECSLVVLSIFVNPLQFGAGEDFDKYPRDPKRDLRIAEKEGVDIVFMPEVSEMYPRPIQTAISVTGMTGLLCGASRPGHFDGVATVVSKLFNIVKPDRAYFGLKDAQQVAVIQKMVEDLNMDVTIVPCPTIREPDGLALSSRNVYLSPEERQEALVIQQALKEAEQLNGEGKAGLHELRDLVIKRISASPLADIDYVEVVSYPSFYTVDQLEKLEPGQLADSQILIAAAVRFGKTRLIDNCILPLRLRT
ncbi:pantoate--beta-alanine ligase [Paenibacillus senegalensis]|uniref:pantoate--beta-alanine ligase n=1 Tax=Paenibacillus senegalensis TaxID=1465766 RepID=UPI0004753168|nr:pantoate--beta-alanine ligase [Paenibacillus senegalensis]